MAEVPRPTATRILIYILRVASECQSVLGIVVPFKYYNSQASTSKVSPHEIIKAITEHSANIEAQPESCSIAFLFDIWCPKFIFFHSDCYNKATVKYCPLKIPCISAKHVRNQVKATPLINTDYSW